MLQGELLRVALSWFMQLASACTHCHANGLVHGQIRPEHALLASSSRRRRRATFPSAPQDAKEPALAVLRDNVAKLLGFCKPELDEARRVPLSRPWGPLDAPELRDRSSAAPDELIAADCWSLGVLLVFMLTGMPPASRPSVLLPPNCHEALHEVVDGLMERDPRRRKPAAWACAKVERLLTEADTPVPPSS